MVTFKIMLKSYLKTLYLSITSALLLIGLAVYQLLAQSSASRLDDPMFYALQFSLIYFAFFLFVSYEFFSKTKRENAEEFISTLPVGNQPLVFSRLLVLVCVAAVFSLSVFALCSAAFLTSGAGHLEYVAYIFLSIFLNIFCVSLVGIFIGMAVSLYFKRTVAYIVILLFTFLCSRLTANLVSATPIYNVYELFNLTVDTTVTPNGNFGYSCLGYRWIRVLFWLALAAALAFIKLYKSDSKKKIITSSVSFVLCALLGVSFYMPVSKVDSNEYYQLEEMDYYDRNEQLSYNADFKITDYAMDFKIGSNLKASVELTLSDAGLPEYRFTLYHGYNVKKVTDGGGNKLDYTREVDYLTVKNNGKSLKKINIEYVGSSMTFYANLQGIYLSGSFPYYPHAGFAHIYDRDSQRPIPYVSQEKASFTVKFRGRGDIYSNLKQDEDGAFRGVTNEAVFISGFMDCKTVNGIKVVYPYLATNMLNPDEIERETEMLTSSRFWKKEIDTIISVPSMNRSLYMLTCGDFMECVGYFDMKKYYEMAFVDDSKTELYFLTFDLINGDTEKFNETMKWQGESDLAVKLKEKIAELGEAAVIEKLDKYLYDSKDTRSVEKFMSEMGAN